MRATGVPFRTRDADAQIAAAREGIGMTKLPCFVGDADRLLTRVPGIDLRTEVTLWLLTHGETRKTKRVRLFTEFVSHRLAAHSPRLAGLPHHTTDTHWAVNLRTGRQPHLRLRSPMSRMKGRRRLKTCLAAFNGGFSIAACVKFISHAIDRVLNCDLIRRDGATRSSCFSSRSAPGRLMMG